MDYLEKITEKPNEDLLWNIPEQKQGMINIVGGNEKSFNLPVKITEFLMTNYPVKTANLILPDVLKNKLPPLDNFVFLPSTESGSLKGEKELTDALNAADYNLILGDLSKNSATEKAVASACQNSEKPVLVTRDAVELITEGKLEQILMNENLIIMGSLAQLQKVFRTVYYPKVLLLSQSLIQVADALHKFTLSYPTSIITLHSGQILIARNGKVIAVPLEKTAYSPLSIWNGELAAKIVALNLYNPNNFIKTTSLSVF